MDDTIKELVEYIEKMGGTVTVDTNPSPEKIKRIKDKIKRNAKLEKLMKKKFDNL